MIRYARVWLPVAILAVGVAGARWLRQHPPVTVADPTHDWTREVEAVTIESGSWPLRVVANGVVEADSRFVLRFPVGGRVERVHEGLGPGARVLAGTELAALDTSKQRAAVDSARAQVAAAKLGLAHERSSAEIAQHDWQGRGRGLDSETRSYALREPHIINARAQLRAAEARLRDAREDLEHMVVRAPFDAVVIDESLEVGAWVAPMAGLATLVDSRRFRAVVSVPLSQLAAIELSTSELGTEVVQADIEWSAGGQIVGRRRGRVIRSLPEVEATTRSARLLIAIDDPLGSTSEDGDASPGPPLMLGSLVRVIIRGRHLTGQAIPRAALGLGGRIWTVDDTGSVPKLRAHQPPILWRSLDDERVIVDAPKLAGRAVVVTKLDAVTPGTPVRVRSGQ